MAAQANQDSQGPLKMAHKTLHCPAPLPISDHLSGSSSLAYSLQPPRPPWFFLNAQNTFLPQGLCTPSILPSILFFLHGEVLHLLQAFIQKSPFSMSLALKTIFKKPTSPHPALSIPLPCSIFKIFPCTYHFLAYGSLYLLGLLSIACYSLKECKLQKNRDIFLLCSLINPKCLELCLLHSSFSISIF